MKNSNEKLQKLVKNLQGSGVLQTKKIIEAFLEIDRQKFVPDDLKNYAYEDNALPIAENQTISQPTTVAFMFELLRPALNQKILDIGAGSGWTSVLLAHLIGLKGKVFAFEINEKIGKFGQKNIAKSGFKNIQYQISNAADDWKKYAPYDRILSGAAFENIPEDLTDQLAPNGILVAPTQNGFVKKIIRLADGDLIEEEFFGFSFVPFVEKKIKTQPLKIR